MEVKSLLKDESQCSCMFLGAKYFSAPQYKYILKNKSVILLNFFLLFTRFCLSLITDLSHFLKWDNLENWLLPRTFSPVCMYVCCTKREMVLICC